MKSRSECQFQAYTTSIHHEINQRLFVIPSWNYVSVNLEEDISGGWQGLENLNAVRPVMRPKLTSERARIISMTGVAVRRNKHRKRDGFYAQQRAGVRWVPFGYLAHDQPIGPRRKGSDMSGTGNAPQSNGNE